MPFSRSRSPESITRSATLSAWWAVNAPAWRSIASTSVVLPWSTWATIATLRRSMREVGVDMRRPSAFGWVSRECEGPSYRRGDRLPASSERGAGWTSPYDDDRRRGGLARCDRTGGMPTIATTDRVDREALLDFGRDRHNFTLMTTRRDGRTQASP